MRCVSEPGRVGLGRGRSRSEPRGLSGVDNSKAAEVWELEVVEGMIFLGTEPPERMQGMQIEAKALINTTSPSSPSRP